MSLHRLGTPTFSLKLLRPHCAAKFSLPLVFILGRLFFPTLFDNLHAIHQDGRVDCVSVLELQGCLVVGECLVQAARGPD